MDPVHREVLNINHQRLVTSLRATDVTERLLTENVLSKYDYDQLKRIEAQGSKAVNRLLILTLERKGQGGAFPAFKQCLLDSDQRELHDVLRGCEVDLQQGILTDRLRRTANPRDAPKEEDMNGHGKLHQNGHSGSPHPSPSPPVLLKASSPAIKSSSSRSKKSRRSRKHRVQFHQAEENTPPSWDNLEEENEEEEEEEEEEEKDEEEEEEERRKRGRGHKRMQKLEDEVQELRESYGKRETELKQQIEQLEKEKKEKEEREKQEEARRKEEEENRKEEKKGKEEGKKKKDGGCAVM